MHTEYSAGFSSLIMTKREVKSKVGSYFFHNFRILGVLIFNVLIIENLPGVKMC